jgi:hypothetical protein
MVRIGNTGQALLKGVIIAVLVSLLGLVALAGPLTRRPDRESGADVVEESGPVDGATTKQFPILDEPRPRAPEFPLPTPSSADSGEAL